MAEPFWRGVSGRRNAENKRILYYHKCVLSLAVLPAPPSRTTPAPQTKQQQQQQARTVRHHCPSGDNNGSSTARGLPCRRLRPQHPQSQSHLHHQVDPLTHLPPGAPASASPVFFHIPHNSPNSSSPADLSYSRMEGAILPALQRPNSFKNL